MGVCATKEQPVLLICQVPPAQLLWEGYCVFLGDRWGKEQEYMVRNNVFSRLEPFHTYKNVPSGKQNRDANVIPHLLPSIFSDIS